MFGIYSNFGPASDLPTRENVLADDTVGGLQGLFGNIATGYVSLGEQWGANNTEFTGTGDALAASLFFYRRR